MKKREQIIKLIEKKGNGENLEKNQVSNINLNFENIKKFKS